MGAGEFSVLYDAYSPEVWYGQSVSYLRKFMLVGAIMFLAPGSTSQTAVTFCIAYFSMISHIKFAPLADIGPDSVLWSWASGAFLQRGARHQQDDHHRVTCPYQCAGIGASDLPDGAEHGSCQEEHYCDEGIQRQAEKHRSAFRLGQVA